MAGRWVVFAAAVVVLGGCAVSVPGKAVPAGSVVPVVAPPSTVTAPPSVVVVQPPPVTVPAPVPTRSLTSCQQFAAEGYSFNYAYDAWVRAGYPLSWDADRDGLPCEQSYGERN
jgi:hypothetical protein